MKAYLGTFTNGFLGAEIARGLSVIELDPATGRLAVVQTVEGLNSPSFVAHHPRLQRLYAVERENGPVPGQGALSTFDISADGTLALVDRRSSGGAFPAHVHLSDPAQALWVANARSAELAMFGLDAQGYPTALQQCIAFQGAGPHPKQQASWLHSVYPDPNHRHVLACDMGGDRVHAFALEAGQLVPRQALHMPPGAGPRHLAFAPDGRHLYIANELDATLACVAYDREHATLTLTQSLACAPQAPTGSVEPSELAVSQDGRFLYCALRGLDQIARFAIDPVNGALRFVDAVACGGTLPRHFALDPSGRWLLVANQLSGTVAAFTVDPSSGHLSLAGPPLRTPCPVCIVYGNRAIV